MEEQSLREMLSRPEMKEKVAKFMENILREPDTKNYRRV